MQDGPVIAAIAALIGDPARANMLTVLMDGRALTVGELARAAGVALPTASGHLAKLDQAGILHAEKQGRHRYFRLSDPDVAQVLEALMNVAQRTGAVRLRTGPSDTALREARVCYDHLAGTRAVRFYDGAIESGLLEHPDDPVPTAKGVAFFTTLGIDIASLGTRRPLCRTCLDWSERRAHLAGSLGAAVLDYILSSGWAKRADGRVIQFTPAGAVCFDRLVAPTVLQGSGTGQLVI